MDVHPRNDRSLAEAVVVAGAERARRRFRTQMAVEYKSGRMDWVTEVDRGAQEAMVALLRLERPDDGIRGEEDGLDLAGARRWLLDPVDGTLAFVQGIPLWTVVAALRDQERTLVSAIYDPVADELFSTQWDGEVLCNSQVASPPQGRALAEAIVRVNFEQRLARSPEIKPIFSRLASSVGAVFTGGSGSLALAWVATGHLHAYVGFHPTASDNEWDWLPGALMVERAGGVAHVSGNWYLAASTAALADELLALVLDAH